MCQCTISGAKTKLVVTCLWTTSILAISVVIANLTCDYGDRVWGNGKFLIAELYVNTIEIRYNSYLNRFHNVFQYIRSYLELN